MQHHRESSLNNRTSYHTSPAYLPHEIPVLYHDDYIVALDKPSGLLSVKGIGQDKIDCLAVRVSSAIEGARIVHRLDMDTSGVIVMARDADSHRELSRQFQDREVEKEYMAVVGGVVEQENGQIDLPIRKDMENPPKQCIDFEHGKPSQTRLKSVACEIRPGSPWNRDGTGQAGITMRNASLKFRRSEHVA